MIDLFSQPQVIGPAIGAFIAIVGVLIAQLLENRRHKVRLNHEAQEREKERKASTRRQIHLQVADDLALALHYIAAFGDLATEPTRREELSKRIGGAFGKLHLVSDFKMVKRTIAFGEAFSNAIYELNLLRITVDQIATALHREERKREHLINQFNAILKATNNAQSNLAPDNFPSDLKTLEPQIHDLSDKCDDLLANLTRERLNLMEAASKKSSELSPLVAEMVVYARNDLELPMREDAASYLAEVKAASERSLSHLQTYLARVKERVGL